MSQSKSKSKSTQASAPSGAARRYAGALLALADEKGQVDAVASDMAAFAELLGGSEALQTAIGNPLLKRDQVSRALNQIIERWARATCSKTLSALLPRMVVLENCLAWRMPLPMSWLSVAAKSSRR